MSPNQTKSCEHEGCRCELATNTAINREGRTYCSARCADGRGCDHASCNCGKFPASDTPHERSV